MKLREALEIQARLDPSGAPFQVFLAAGFTPLHLVPFLTAHLRLALPARPVRITQGLFGDLAGSIEGLIGKEPASVVVLIEWGDLDPRLGLRGAGAWCPREIASMADSAAISLTRLETALRALGASRLIVCLPQLPLPPIPPNGPWESSPLETRLHAMAAAFADRVCSRGGSVVRAAELDRISPPGQRYNAASDLKTGHPYTLTHVDALAGLLARQLCPPLPKKGLITDLDHTLWSGILGEVGVEHVTWSQEAHSQSHAIYQVFLDSLAASGVLLAAASRNDAFLTEQALARRDLRLDASRLFPVEANWGPKSDSVGRIIRAWNIGADSVVFVDDSPMELAEVKAAHPDVECLLFEPGGDQLWTLLRQMRSLFAKSKIEDEDLLRLESIRQSAQLQSETARSTPEEILRGAEAAIRFSFQPCADSRSFELINKTNQFNLNGVRFSEDEWREKLARPGAFLMTASYEDRFGPLGKIAVALGCVSGERAWVDSWVMSCRAFSRRAEHACLQAMFENLQVSEVTLAFQTTARNGPLREFLSSLGVQPETGNLIVTRKQFEAVCPALYHKWEVAGAWESARSSS